MTVIEDRIIGRYELIRSLGKGSQGSVYLARDPTLDRLVAIKVLTDAGGELNALSEDGTPREARISSKLTHPNIVPIYDAGACEMGPYLVFEFVEGKPLSQILESGGALSIENAVPLFSAILQALSFAHTSEILHLDLSPRNILMDENNVPRVMDFGLAQHISHVHEASDTATGTLRYMSPEHFLGKPLGTWTDVFALGITFYEMVTGQRAMQGMTIEQVQLQIVAAEVDFSAFKAMPYGEAFARFLAGALERQREGRYADCAIMQEAFSMFLRETGLIDKAGSGDTQHSTIEYLLRRMQRKKDFPTISRTLTDINELTSEDSYACADKLANVILRDFALTSKLLKLVNSAFYGARATEITSISQAVVFLGLEQLRMTANSLTFFGHLNGDSTVLKDSMTRSFMSGLIARHLAQRAKLPRAEEAFICGMCQNLGENLAIYYFADEHGEINALMRERRLRKASASRGVLGVSYAELGAAVAATWKLPRSILDSILGMPPGPVTAPVGEADALRKFAVFANELCALFQDCEASALQGELQLLLAKYEACIDMDHDYCRRLLAAGLEKLQQYAPIFEIKVGSSAYCRAVQAWLERDPAAEPVSLAIR
jgi:serine/threonine protein kinase